MDHVVAGSLHRIGESYVINLQLLDIVEASVSRRFSRRMRGGSAEAFLDIVGPAAKALFRTPGARLRAPGPRRRWHPRGPATRWGSSVGLR